MSRNNRALLELFLGFLILVLISLLYVVFTWPTNPQKVISNLDHIGPLAFLLDLVVCFFFYRVWKKSRLPEQPDNVWE